MNPILSWMIETCLLVAILIPLVSLACLALKNRPAWRHALWAVLLLKLVTPPIVSWPWSFNEVTHDLFATVPKLVETDSAASNAFSAPHVAAFAENDLPGDEAVTFPIDRAEGRPESAESTASPSAGVLIALKTPAVSWLIVSVWFAGCLVVALRLLQRLLRQRAIVTGGTDAPQCLAGEAKNVSRLLKVRQVPVRVTSAAASPFLWCFGGLRLVWPTSLASETEIRRSRGIIAHELAHVGRRDHWVAWIELIAAILWWWNPLFWLVRRRLHESAEMACDAIALSVYDNRREYAELFLELSSRGKSGPPSPVLGISARSPSSFERRLSMILSERVSGNFPLWGLLVVGGMAAATLPNWAVAQAPIESPRSLPSDSAAIEQPRSVSRPVTEDTVRSVLVRMLAGQEGRNLNPDSIFGMVGSAEEKLTLVDAVARFNDIARQNSIGESQEPLTVDEVIASIGRRINEIEINAPSRSRLERIAETGTLEPGDALQFSNQMFREGRVYTVWWVDVRAGTYRFRIRDRTLSSREQTAQERAAFEEANSPGPDEQNELGDLNRLF